MIYFANECGDPRLVGACYRFENKETLLYEHEHWYENIGHLVFDTNGDCFKMKANADNNTLSLVELRSKVHPDTVAAFILFFTSKTEKSGYDMDLCPEVIELIEDHHDYPTEPPKNTNHDLHF